MNQGSHAFQGEQVTFRGLFDRHPIVKIPIIQRDYAHGRQSAKEVRTEFLNAICRALEKSDHEDTHPLDLDFVYGSVEGSEQKAFLPLDGQQRLTTLFLLHWYLAWKDGKWDDFTAFIKDGGESRLSYAVRPSSEEFFDFLVNYFPRAIPSGGLKLSDIMADQSQFFRSWKQDPTIQSALEVLDAIDEKFASKTGFYERLVRTDRPYITFQLLNLKHFGLSDELYIKMNARGKALTAFETFKAKLEQKLDALFPVEVMILHGKKVSTKAYISDRIDTAWADMFWNYRDRRTHLFDEKIMNLLRALVIVTREPGNERTDTALKELIVDKLPFSFFKYEQRGCIDRALVETFISVLDLWFKKGTAGIRTHLRDAAYFDEKGIFESIINDATKLTYAELVTFHAYCAYIRKNKDNLQSDRFWEWMRVIKNLAENTNYDGLDDFTRSIRAVNDLLNASQHILDELANPKVKVQGFNEQQVREERLKAQLINKNGKWCSQILEAETHGYFKGQIEFVFAFSGVLNRWLEIGTCTWSEPEDDKYQISIADYFAKASAAFSTKGLNDFGEYRWERALLSIGDYLLPQGNSGNRSFLVNSDRDVSWKRLLQGAIDPNASVERKRSYVKTLFDQIDLNSGIKGCLDSVINHANPSEEWRRVIVAKPEMIEFCNHRMIRFESEKCVYLLRKVRMSGEHAELFTYCLKVGFLAGRHEKGLLAPFAEPIYHAVNTDSEQPCAYLEYKCDEGIIVLDIFNDSGDYELQLFNRDKALPPKLKDTLKTSERFTDKETEVISRTVARLNIEEAIDGVVSAIRGFASTTTK